MKFCNDCLTNVNIDITKVHDLGARFTDGSPLYRVAYFYLRKMIANHCEEGGLPTLTLCVKPTKAYGWSVPAEPEEMDCDSDTLGIPETDQQETGAEALVNAEAEVENILYDLICTGGEDSE